MVRIYGLCVVVADVHNIGDVAMAPYQTVEDTKCPRCAGPTYRHPRYPRPLVCPDCDLEFDADYDESPDVWHFRPREAIAQGQFRMEFPRTWGDEELHVVEHAHYAVMKVKYEAALDNWSALLKENAILKAELKQIRDARAKAADGKTVCEDCGSILMRF